MTIAVVLIALVGFVATDAIAYGPRAHTQLTSAAYDRWAVTFAQQVLRLQIPPDGRLVGTDGNEYPIDELLNRGARNEDNFDSLELSSPFKVIQHFFDPQRGAGLTTCPLPPCHPSPDWALEDRGMVRLEDDRLCLGPAESPDCRQTFSYGDARRAMLAGLQGETEQDRKVQFGRMFEALGHVIHQHTRADVPPPVFSDRTGFERDGGRTSRGDGGGWRCGAA